MTLETDTDLKIENPSADQVRNEVVDLTNRDGSFVILSSGPMDYMQVAADRYARFTVEYQEGDATRHFRAKEELEQAFVADLLIHYHRGDAKWKEMVEWQQDAIETGWKIGNTRWRVSLLNLISVLWVFGGLVILPSLVVHGQWANRLFSIGVAIFGLGFVANVVSGILDLQMWSRSSIITPGLWGGMLMFRVLVALNALVAGICAWGCATFW